MALPRPRVAIVGAGPAGAYAAACLLRASGDVEIDLSVPENAQSVLCHLANDARVNQFLRPDL